MTEVELQLRLDPEGRTISEEDGGPNEDKPNLDYSSKTVLTSVADDSNTILFPNDGEKRTKLLDELLFDCEITDCALLPRTFWMPATGMKPRCALEQCALEVFQHHVKEGVPFDPKTSGAEWWVQIRPSPPMGRYNLLVDADEDKGDSSEVEVNLEKSGICFHWDKDEDLRLMMGGNMYIHPHISTVTYLSNSGAPTMALNYRVNTFTGEYMSPYETESVDAYLSWPKKGKHLSFDGRFLHAAPSNLMKDGEFENQIKVSDDITDETERKKETRRKRRVTFLVNIWLNYKPFNTEPFPETMMDKMTKPSDEVPNILFKSGEDSIQKKEVCPAKSQSHDGSNGGVSFKWSMGGCDSNESISMQLPLELIQHEMQDGGNVQMSWSCQSEVDRGVRILVGQTEEKSSEEEQEKKRRKVE